MFASTMKYLYVRSHARYKSSSLLVVGYKKEMNLIIFIILCSLTSPPREIYAYAFSNGANGAYLFYIYLLPGVEISSQTKAYTGIKSLSCSSLTTNNTFRSLLAGVFVLVAFPER